MHDIDNLYTGALIHDKVYYPTLNFYPNFIK